MSTKIGVGVITTGKRELKNYQLHKDTLFLPFVDTERKGASYGRNHLMKTFYDQGCDYWFIFDDDAYPTMQGWEKYFTDIAQKENWDFFGMPEFFKDKIKGFFPNSEVAIFDRCLTQFAMYSRKSVESAGYYRRFSHRYGFEDSEYIYRLLSLQQNKVLNNGVKGFPCPVRVMAYIHPDDVFGNNPSPYANVSIEERQTGINMNMQEYNRAKEDVEHGKLFWSYEEAQGAE